MLYPVTLEVLAFQLSATECCTTPVPVSETAAGDPLALLTIDILPFTAPATLGLNCSANVTLCDGVRVTGALPPVMLYPAPVNVICEIATLEFPVSVITTFCVADELPVVTLPKLKLIGLMPNVKVAAIPVPLRLTEVGDVAALLTIVMLPAADPTAGATKATVTETC
jgi:hypothetical protein